MTRKTYAQILNSAVSGRIPGSVDLAPQIIAQIDTERKKTMPPKMKLATTILIVLIAVLALSTAAYAVYHFVIDPGLQSVLDAGMESTVQVTARPTLQPTATPLGTPLPASMTSLSQTLEGVTLNVDWVYLDEGRLAFGLGFSDLPADTQLGAPQVNFAGVTPQQALGFSQSIRAGEHSAIYVSYQVIHTGEVGGKLSLGVDVPLVRSAAEQPETLTSFHFDLKDVPVYQGNNLPIGQTYAARVNGLEVRLKSVRVLPTTTEVVACYDFPTPNAVMAIVQDATLQMGDGPEVGYTRYNYLTDITDDHCVRLGFPVGNIGGADRLVFRVHKIVVPLTTPEEKAEGSWEFYVDLPSTQIVPGLSEPTPIPTLAPTPIGEQTLDNVSMSLDWVYADVKRIAFGYTITGLPDVPDAVFLNGHLDIQDSQGNRYTSAGYGGQSAAQRVDGKPDVYTGIWSEVLQTPLPINQLALEIDVTLDGTTQRDFPLAVIQRPADATPFPDYLPPGYVLPSVPDRLVGTFHFEATTDVYPMQVFDPKQVVETNGVAMRLERAEVTPSYAQFILCYNKPTKADWWVMGSGANDFPTLRAGDYVATISGGSLLADAEFGGPVGKGLEPTYVPPVGPGERCLAIDFQLGLPGQTGSLTLTVPNLVISMPEVVPDADMKAAQEKLRMQGIEMSYGTSTFAGGGGGGGSTFTQMPDGMTEQEALRRFEEALGYIHPGPWSFEIQVP